MRSSRDGSGKRLPASRDGGTDGQDLPGMLWMVMARIISIMRLQLLLLAVGAPSLAAGSGGGPSGRLDPAPFLL